MGAAVAASGVALAGLAWAGVARADVPAGAETRGGSAAVAVAPANETDTAPVFLVTRGDTLDVARLSALIGAELDRSVVLESAAKPDMLAAS